MTVALLSYQHEHFDSLPPVIEAERNARRSGALDALSDAIIGGVFIKHRMQRDFGIILLHNHFSLLPSERLVQFANAAIPWDITRNSADLNKVLPSAWRFVEEGLAPYEFVYANPRDVNTNPIPVLDAQKHEGFLSELQSVLAGLRLTSILGLCILEEKDINASPKVEIESGRSTITLDVDINPQDSDGFIHMIWQFGANIGYAGQPVVFRKYKVKYEMKKLDGDWEHWNRHLTTKL